MNYIDKESFLLITLDSCRYDTYLKANTPNFDKIGQVHKAYAPGNFTLPSHMAMFCGFTPGDPESDVDFVNPKRKRVWKLSDVHGKHFIALSGTTIVDGFNKKGYETIGTGGVGWFDPIRTASQLLTDKFRHFEYFGTYFYLPEQIKWLRSKIKECQGKRKFVFLNIGETHEPYWHEGAQWDKSHNSADPFGRNNNRELCEYRQKKCLEFADNLLGDFLEEVGNYNILICGDHGDAWGEDGLWGHSIHHEKVYEVPLVIKINKDIEYSNISQNVGDFVNKGNRFLRRCVNSLGWRFISGRLWRR